MHSFATECQCTGARISCHALVMLLPYRVKILDKKSNTFHAILALCTVYMHVTGVYLCVYIIECLFEGC